jgi:ankyrin repeat protein
VEEGADLNLVDLNHNSALIIAAKQGKIEIVKLLVDAGAKLNLIGKGDQTAL